MAIIAVFTSDFLDIIFDPKFFLINLNKETVCLRLRNLENALHFKSDNTGICRNQFQADTFPNPLCNQVSVLHDRIYTTLACFGILTG